MAKIRIQGIKPYDGEYDLDTDQAFNAREWRWIKKVSGYLPLTVSDGFAGGDPDLFVALAVIAMCREGKIGRDAGLEVAETLAEAPFDGAAIILIGDGAEDDSPLGLTSEPDEPSPTSSLEKPSSTGDPSRSGSDPSDAHPPATTALRSVTSSA